MRLVLALLILCTLLALGAQVAAAQPEDGTAVPEATATDAPSDSQPAAPPDIEGDPIGSIEQFVLAIKSGNWKMVGSLALALVMLVLVKLRDRIKWFAGDRGGAVLVMVLGLLGGFAAALHAGATVDWKLVLGIVGTVWTAVGGVQWVKRLIWPQDKVA